jgi:hypothetical protein
LENWITDYKLRKNNQQETTILNISDYLYNSDNIKNLNKEEKENLSLFLNAYEKNEVIYYNKLFEGQTGGDYENYNSSSEYSDNIIEDSASYNDDYGDDDNDNNNYHYNDFDNNMSNSDINILPFYSSDSINEQSMQHPYAKGRF